MYQLVPGIVWLGGCFQQEWVYYKVAKINQTLDFIWWDSFRVWINCGLRRVVGEILMFEVFIPTGEKYSKTCKLQIQV